MRLKPLKPNKTKTVDEKIIHSKIMKQKQN